MGLPVLILGESGSGKSYSIKNMDADSIGIFEVEKGLLPFKNKGFKVAKNATYGMIMVALQKPQLKRYVIDDSQYLMAFDSFDKANEKGYDKFNDIGGGLVDVLRTADILRDDIKVIFTSHSENTGDSMNPHWTLKTIGRMLNEKITPEGLFTYIFYAMAINNGETIEYKMLTNTDGEHVAKTSLGMFEDKLIDNDISKVIEIIDRYSSGE